MGDSHHAELLPKPENHSLSTGLDADRERWLSTIRTGASHSINLPTAAFASLVAISKPESQLVSQVRRLLRSGNK